MPISRIKTDGIQDDAITSAKIGDTNIAAADIADNAVTTAKIADSQITDAKIASGITASKLTGDLPAISGANLTGVGVDGITSTANATAITIDSSENILAGKTSSAFNTAGFELFGNADKGKFWATRDGGVAAAFNRKSSDGDIALFAKDGTTVGSVATYGGDLIVGTGDTRLRFIDSLDSIFPVSNSTGTSRDAGIDLGHSETRFKDIYTSGGIYLGAASNSTPVAANYLDDYEEGTWTPTVAGVNNTPTYYNNYGKYTKVGRKVTIQFFQQTWVAPTFSTNSAVFRITGIPFTCLGSGYSGSQGSMNSQGFHFNGSSNNQFTSGQVEPSVGNDGGLALSFSVTSSGGTRGQVINSAAGSGYIIEATVTYFTNQ